MITRCVDLMVTVHNRAEYTRECLTRLVRNTSWEYVRELTLYDVHSEDGARQVIDEVLLDFKGAPFWVWDLVSMTVHDVQNIHVQRARAPFVAKIDNDTVVPREWLDVALAILKRVPEIGILGLYPWLGAATKDLPVDRYEFSPQIAVGGLFVARTEVFHNAPRLPKTSMKYYGFQEWQRDVIPSVKKAWIRPGIHVILLDMLPMEPWESLGKMYIEKGWQRKCPPYPPGNTAWEKWKREHS